MKIYISPNLTPMVHPKGWPELQSFEWHIGQSARAKEYEELIHNEALKKEYEDTVVSEYDKALEKAKREAVEFKNDEDRLYVQRLALELIDWTPQSVVQEQWNSMKPDTFIDVEIGEVEFVFQRLDGIIGAQSWIDTNKRHYMSMADSFPNRFRVIARLKPKATDMQVYTNEPYGSQGIGLVRQGNPDIKPKAENLSEWRQKEGDFKKQVDEEVQRVREYIKRHEVINPDADFDHMVNQQKIIDVLRADLAAAQKRIEELTKWEDVLKVRIKELEEQIEFQGRLLAKYSENE